MADKKLRQLIINKGTEAKFNALTEKSDEQLYFITDSNTYVTTDQGVNNAGKILTVGDDGKLFPAQSEDSTGIKGDYCSTYGIVDMQHGIITTPAEGNVLNIPSGIVLKLLGADSLITLASPQTYQVEAAIDFTLFYTRKEDATAASFVEATEVYYSSKEPAPNGQTGFQAWKKSGDSKWQFRSNATGNEWREAIATPICDVHFTDGHLTRIDFAGYRLMNTQDFARRDSNNTFIGDNTIEGENAELKFQSTVDVIGSAPTSQKNYGIIFKDHAGALVGQYTVHHGTNNEVYSQILVKNPTSNQAAILNIGFNQSGTEYVDASAGVKQAIVEWGNAKYQAKDKRVTKLSAQSTDDEYPTAKCVYDLVGDVETLLHNINTGA